MSKPRPYSFPILWFITITTTIISIATIYAFIPFIPQPNSPIKTTSLPYLNPQAHNISIQLPNRTLNPFTSAREPLDDRLSSHQLNPQDQILYLVQFKKPISLSDLSIIAYFPTNTYLIRSNITQINNLAQNPLTNFIDYYPPEYKLNETLITNIPLQNTQNPKSLVIIADPAQNQDTLYQQIFAIDPNAQIESSPTTNLFLTFQITINESKIIDLARLPQIISIQ